jgi:hypothetical protein
MGQLHSPAVQPHLGEAGAVGSVDERLVLQLALASLVADGAVQGVAAQVGFESKLLNQFIAV